MLISIAGSQGTGKSTLIDALGYPSVKRKSSRSILADWNVSLAEVNSDPKLTIKFQDEIIKRKLDDERGLKESDQIWVTERTFTDLFVYALVTLGKDNAYSEWLDDYYQRCYDAQQELYSSVVYLKAGAFKPVNDGVRGANQWYSRMVDVTMQDLLPIMLPKTSVLYMRNKDTSDSVNSINMLIASIKPTSN